MSSSFQRVPPDALQKETLHALVEEFVTRDGTDYGLVECSLEDKVQSVLRQLENEELLIVYDLELESCTIIPTEEWVCDE